MKLLWKESAWEETSYWQTQDKKRSNASTF